MRRYKPDFAKVFMVGVHIIKAWSGDSSLTSLCLTFLYRKIKQ